MSCLAGTGVFAVTGGGTLNLNGIISGAGFGPTLGGSSTGILAIGGTSNTYTGATTINSGTLQLIGSGEINTSSGITINGSNAEFLQISSTASTPTITLTQGMLDGTGAVGNVNVGAGTGGIVQNGNGAAHGADNGVVDV